ncbi:Flp family type IVb pilin [Altererythrobacter epoxidivorans]
MTMTFIKNFARDESGASAAEYALILAIVGAAIGGAALALGTEVDRAIDAATADVKACNDGDTTACVAT